MLCAFTRHVIFIYKKHPYFSPVLINNKPVEIVVDELKYLGTIFDRTLSFTANTVYI